jgi:hypothetical protein
MQVPVPQHLGSSFMSTPLEKMDFTMEWLALRNPQIVRDLLA